MYQGLPIMEKPLPVSMEVAEDFFIKEPDSSGEKEQVSYFEEHITDPQLIQSKLDSGVFVEGTVRTNPKFKHRAFVSCPGLDADILIKGFTQMNRAMNGDTVLVELTPVH